MGVGAIAAILLGVVVSVQAYLLRRYYGGSATYDEWKDRIARESPVSQSSGDIPDNAIVGVEVNSVFGDQVVLTIYCRTVNGDLHRWKRTLVVDSTLTLENGKFNTCDCEKCVRGRFIEVLPSWI